MRRFFPLVIGNRFVREGCLLTFIVGLLLTLETLMGPQMYDIRYSGNGVMNHAAHFPVSIPVTQNVAMMEVWAKMNLHPLQTKILRIGGNDCVLELSINGQKVTSVQNCSVGVHGKDIDLSSYLQSGENELHLTIKNIGGMVLRAWIGSPRRIFPFNILHILCMALITGWIFSIFTRTLLKKQSRMTELLALGFELRALYAWNTFYTTRSYDASQHIDYVHYVMQHWVIPPAKLGWEFHQAPLYYFLMAIIMKMSVLLRFSVDTAILAMQYFSFVLSCLTLAAAAWCALLLFPNVQQRRSQLLYFGIVTFFPGLLMFASRISNDALFQLISFLFLGSLLTWWKAGQTRWLVATSTVIGIGLLIKATSILFIPILLICILFRPLTTVSQKYTWIWQTIAILIVIAGWLFMVRFLGNDLSRVVAAGNIGALSQLAIPNTFSTYLAFNVSDVLAHPYANAWVDIGGRQRFWEFIFKTSLFGGFSYLENIVHISRILLILFMGSLMISVVGTVRAIKVKDSHLIPLLVSLLIILAGAVFYRFLHPLASNQDFRFSLLLLPLLAYFAVLATETKRKYSSTMRAWLIAFMAMCGLFILLVSFFGPS